MARQDRKEPLVAPVQPEQLAQLASWQALRVQLAELEQLGQLVLALLAPPGAQARPVQPALLPAPLGQPVRQAPPVLLLDRQALPALLVALAQQEQGRPVRQARLGPRVPRERRYTQAQRLERSQGRHWQTSRGCRWR